MEPTPRAFRPEALLAHREWIERAARALVHGDADAEDLGQQAWLGILERPPAREPESPRGWLWTVLRFRATDASRAAAARRRHEVAAARPERVDASPVELVARAETLDRVAHAVLGLEEPYRATVLLRWFEDLRPGAIARLQGIPVETVRTRLKRALALLRERLDAENGGDRRRWCLALLPLLRRPSSRTAGAAGAVGAAAAGALLMGIKAKVAFAAVAAAFVIAGGWLVLRPSEPGSGPRPPGIRWESPKPVAVQPTEGPPPEPRFAGLSVRIEDADGKPIPGARVEVRPARSGVCATWCGDRLLASGETDAAGRLSFDLPPAALAQGREIRAAARGFTKVSLRTNESEVVIRLFPSAILRGRVLEAATGRGLRDISLVVVQGRGLFSAEIGSGMTGEDGAFSLDHLPPGNCTLRTRSPLWLDAEVPDLALEIGNPRTVDVPLSSGVRMVGRVLDAESGAPVETGRVTIPGSPWIGAEKSADLGAGGRFLLGGLAAWVETKPSFSTPALQADGYGPGLSTQTAPAWDMSGKQTREAVFQAVPEATWDGRVLDPEGRRGVQGARVVIGPLSMLQHLQEVDSTDAVSTPNLRLFFREARTDAHGRFRLPAGWLMRAQGNNSEKQRVLVLHPDYAPHYETVGPDHWKTQGEVRLGPGLRLDITVTDVSGRPEPGAEVRTAFRDPFQEFPFRGDILGSYEGPALTDLDGRVSLLRLCPGEWQVRAWSADGRRWTVNSVKVEGPGPSACQLVLEPAPPVLGTVVDDANGTPLPGAVVQMWGFSPYERRTVVADTVGRFEFLRPEKDEWTPGFRVTCVHVPGAGRWLPLDNPLTQPGEPVTLRMRCFIRATREISGRVLDAATGAPVSEGLIKCAWIDPQDRSKEAAGFDQPFMGGAFRRPIPIVEGLRLTFWSADYEPLTLTPETLEAQGFEVRLVPKGPREQSKYRVRVRVAGGEHPVGKHIPVFACVYLYDPETKLPLREKNSRMDSGSHEFLPEFVLTERELPGPGRILIDIQVHGWHLPAPVPCEVEAGRETEVYIDLVRGSGAIAGTAEPGCRITLTHPTGLTRSWCVAEDGEFFVGMLPPGTYSLRVEDRETITARVVDGDTTKVDLR